MTGRREEDRTCFYMIWPAGNEVRRACFGVYSMAEHAAL